MPRASSALWGRERKQESSCHQPPTPKKKTPRACKGSWLKYLGKIGLPWWFSGKNPACHRRRHGFDPWVGKIPWRWVWQSTPVFLPGKSHGNTKIRTSTYEFSGTQFSPQQRSCPWGLGLFARLLPPPLCPWPTARSVTPWPQDGKLATAILAQHGPGE